MKSMTLTFELLHIIKRQTLSLGSSLNCTPQVSYLAERALKTIAAGLEQIAFKLSRNFGVMH